MHDFPDAAAELARLRTREAWLRRTVMLRQHAETESGERDHALPMLVAEREDVRQRIRLLRVYVARTGSRAVRSVLPLFARMAPRLARAPRTGRRATLRRVAAHSASSAGAAEPGEPAAPGDGRNGFPPVAGTWEAGE